MASSSTSSVNKRIFKYDVFLSFRGEDTRTNFVDHLYDALKRQGIDTYKDDKNLEKGKRISKELIEAIEESRFHVVVFSKNYASSSWCLDELVKIMECQMMKTGQTVYPIFYHVEPTHVRKQSGEFGKAFSKHENDEAAKKWKEALIEATSLSGRELRTTADGHEVDFIKLVVKDISLKLPIVSADDENLVGMRTRVNGVLSSINAVPDEFCMIGIWGMGGGGKTTLARAVFDQICNEFEGSSFVENVRESSTSLLLGLKSLQQQVLRDVLKRQDIFINGVLEGKKEMKKKMHGLKVLVVLDDVDHIDQLKALAGEPNWFKSGSKIIVTTRDKQVLLAHKVNSILDVNLLTHEEAICLLSRCAFGTEIPSQGYEELSMKVVSYAVGLPLTITILGSALYGETEHVWEDTLKELEKIPLDGTLQRLELSYKGLDTNCQEIFLDIACMLKGWKKEKVMRVLESCGFHAIRGLSVLEKKSLVTTRDGRLEMHDHIQEMGRYIVRRLHPDEPNKHSRLWIGEEIEDILASDPGTNEAIRCIRLTAWKVNPEVVMKGLRNMKQLRFLHVFGEHFLDNYWKSNEDEDCSDNSCEFDDVGRYFPNALRWLSWKGYPFRSLPKSFQANNLVALEIHYSKIVQLWEWGDRKVLNKLKFLKIKNSKLKNLDLALTPNLEKLCLKGCLSLVEIHIPIECPKLIYLNICYSKLTTFDLRGTPNLVTLRLEKCFDLLELHIPVECLKLESVIIFNSKLRTLDLRGALNIENLDLEECYDLVELQIPVECLKLESVRIFDSKLRIFDIRGALNLEELRVFTCAYLVELHIPVECRKLVSININGPKLRTLDLRGTPNIEELYLRRCVDLVEIHMPVECLKLVYIYINDSKLKNLDLGLTPNLERLSLIGCTDLVEFRMPDECPKLIYLCLSASTLTTLDLRWTLNIEELDLGECVDLVELHIPVECQKLKSVDINGSKLSTLDLRGTPNLKSLSIYKCVDLTELHIRIECLKLESINIDGTKLRTLDLQGTLNIENLHLQSCVDLVQLHVPVECLKLKSIKIKGSKLTTLDLRGIPNLETLYIEECVDLVELQIPVECLKLKSIKIQGSKLTTLDLRGAPNIEKLRLKECVGFVELHIPVECLKLKSISIIGAKFTYLPDSICMLKHLKCLELNPCWLLEKLPEDLGRLECLEKLILSECVFLRDIPNSICKMKRLECFHLRYCVAVEKLPEELGRLECLKELNIQGTNIRHLPQSIYKVKGLRIVGFRWLLQLCGFTSEIQASEGETFFYVEL